MQYLVFVLAFVTLACRISTVVLGSALEGASSLQAVIPFHASIQFMGHHRCSGAVIGESLVITAAQCVHKANIDYLEVAVGPNKDMVHQVLRVAVDPLYDPFNQDYNFAVVKVESPFRLGESVVPIDLASNPLGDPKPLHPVLIIEWNIEQSKVVAHNSNPLDDVKCAALYRITNRMLCTEATSGLEGDIGAPLVYDGHLRGILTTVARRPGSDVGVYASVYPYAHSLAADEMTKDSVMDQMCDALRTIIDALENMAFIPSFIVSAVKYLANLLHCNV